MGLIPDIDKVATINNVQNFFFDDDKYQKIKNNALSDGVKSSAMDVTGSKSSGATNRVERMNIYYSECSKAKSVVEDAINTLRAVDQVILKLRYEGNWTVQGIKDKVAEDFDNYGFNKRKKKGILGHTTYTKADNQACIDFAEACDRLGDERGVNRELLPFFVVLVDEKTGVN